MRTLGYIVTTNSYAALAFTLLRQGLSGWAVVGRYHTYNGAAKVARRLGLTLPPPPPERRRRAAQARVADALDED